MPPVPPPKLPTARRAAPKALAARRPAPTVPPPALRVSGPASAAAQPQRPARPVPSVSAPVSYRAVTVNGRRRIEAHLPGRAQPVGHVDVALREGHAEILNLNVKPEFRRQAIGAQLVRQSVQLARAQSAASIHLTARPSPGGAPAAALVAMYRKAGFQPNGMSPAGLRMALPGTVQRSARPVVPPPAVRAEQPIRPVPAGRGLVQRSTPNFRAAVIQRAEQVPGFSGFYSGKLSESQQQGTFNTVYSQPNFGGDLSPVASSSAKLGVGARRHLVDFAEVDHLDETTNNHAEDKLFAFVHQLIAAKFPTNCPISVEVPVSEFYVSASPCTSAGGTSGKGIGCTENLIEWATTGMILQTESACPVKAVVKIGKLVVDHLYKGNTKDGAAASYEALVRMKKAGAIGGWRIVNMPRLKDFEGKQEA